METDQFLSVFATGSIERNAPPFIFLHQNDCFYNKISWYKNLDGGRMHSMFLRPRSVENLAFFDDFDEILNFTLIYALNFS